ncbi:MAG: YeeE/YedE family protein [Alphaproteobacteria bacterium]|jgi:uncharacterized membrane protein YedE/YeeE|nr:YeeE/YedE family protein [Alphaproteobacteria bacterium]
MQIIMALISGVVFGVGLTIAGMLDPSKISGFLNIFGLWDPSLAFVMAGGVAINAAGHRLIMKQSAPLFALRFSLPSLTSIDRPLLLGSAIFGIGWGVSGLCPGPVLGNLLLIPEKMGLFAAIVCGGLWVGRALKQRLFQSRVD